MTQAERGLAGIDAGAEQLEFEDGLQRAEIGRREGPDAQRLWRTPANVRLSSPNSFSTLGSLVSATCRTNRVNLLEVVADVEHREAVDLEARLG